MTVYEMSYAACMEFIEYIGSAVKDPYKAESLIDDFLCGRLTDDEVLEAMG